MTPDASPTPDNGLYLDAAIAPNRSLSRRGFHILIGVLIGMNLAMGAYFLAIGAIPVPVFLGLDVIGVLIAFKVSYRRARLLEHVRVTPGEVTVLRDLPRGQVTAWRSATAFTRVDIAEGQDDAVVRLTMSGRSILVGGALSPGERVDLGHAIERAIRAARLDRTWTEDGR